MSDFTDLRLPSGAIVYVQPSLQPPPPSGLAQASGAAEKARGGRAHLERALQILKTLDAEDRLDANRKGWLAQIEAQLAP